MVVVNRQTIKGPQKKIKQFMSEDETQNCPILLIQEQKGLF